MQPVIKIFSEPPGLDLGPGVAVGCADITNVRAFDVAADDALAKRNALVLAVAQALAGANHTVIVATAGIVGAVIAPDKSLATLPIYIRRLHVALLSDVATAFDTTFDPSNDVRWSIGGALRVDALFGYFVPGTFEIGYARGLVQGGVNESWFPLTGSL